jgi:hypothetical protein
MSGARSALSWVNMLKRTDYSFRDRLSVNRRGIANSALVADRLNY